MKDKKITIEQIAEKAGVSVATVSRAYNHPEKVRKSTLENIRLSIKELKFANVSDVSEPSSKAALIIVNLPKIGNPFYSDILQGIRNSADLHHYHVLINHDSLNPSSAEMFCIMLKTVQAAGVLTLGYLDQEVLEKINYITPVVQCCEFNREAALPYVSIDDYAAACSAVEYLIASGKQKIAFLSGPQHCKYASERYRGFCDTMKKHGLSFPSAWVSFLPDINYDMAFSAAGQILSSSLKPDAFFTSSDIQAAGVVRAALKKGLSIPEELSVIGFDNINLSSIMVPTITTVNQPKFQLGFAAGELLHETIMTPGLSYKTLLLDTELIIRESTL